jgi:hypothetical protein
MKETEEGIRIKEGEEDEGKVGGKATNSLFLVLSLYLFKQSHECNGSTACSRLYAPNERDSTYE